MNKYRVATIAKVVVAAALAVSVCAALPAAEPESGRPSHPLDPVIAWAEKALEKSAQIKDYTALLVKRERVGDELREYEFMRLKVRHEPFSVYIKFLKPEAIKGREIIYVEGRNDGMLLAHDSAGLGDLVGTVSLAPDGVIAMLGQRYPVTMIGIKKLGERLIEQAKRDRQIMAPCEAKFVKGAKVNGRPTQCVEVAHPSRHPDHRFSSARVFIDEEMGIPIRFESYHWSDDPKEGQVLVEEYTYSHVQLNVGLTDLDFDPKNPAYDFD